MNKTNNDQTTINFQFSLSSPRVSYWLNSWWFDLISYDAKLGFKMKLSSLSFSFFVLAKATDSWY